MRQNFDIPVDLGVTNIKLDELPLESRLACVQVGVWEVRRRWLAGDTADLDRLLACLDEDIQSLRADLDTTDQHAQPATTVP